VEPSVEKRYQIFISSTQRDLEDERRTVVEALLRVKHIPVAMEQFTSSPQRAWPLMEQILDECDYCVVIVAGVYGQPVNPELNPSGRELSFTENEYEYAQLKGIPVLAFLYKDIESLPEQKTQESNREKLLAFRDRLENELTVDYWTNGDELANKVSAALYNKMKESERTGVGERIGWIRGDAIPQGLLAKKESIVDPCELVGIASLNTDGIAGEAMRENLGTAQKIRTINTTGVRFFERYEHKLVDALKNGCSIQVLVPKPGSEFLFDVTESESKSVARDTIDSEIGIIRSRLIEALSEATEAADSATGLGTIWLGYFTTHLRSSIVLCDEDWGWLTLVLPPRRAVGSISFELKDSGEAALIKQCITHFDRIWEIVTKRGDFEVLSPVNPEDGGNE
jgi:hypothetical protein